MVFEWFDFGATAGAPPTDGLSNGLPAAGESGENEGGAAGQGEGAAGRAAEAMTDQEILSVLIDTVI